MSRSEKEVDKVGEASRNGGRKRSKAELEVRNRAGVCVCVWSGGGGATK